MKKQVELDSRRMNYKDMSDNELTKNQMMSYSFKFMETAADKEMARKAM